MPVLQGIEQVKKFYLPSTQNIENIDDRAWVMFDVSPAKIGDFLDVGSGMTSSQVGIAMVANRIKEWNYFYDVEKANPVPINLDTVALLAVNDFEFLAGLIPAESKGLGDDEKKASPDTSSESVTVNLL